MALELDWGDLASRAVRSEIGQRVIRSPEQPLEEDGNFVTRWLDDNAPWLANAAKKLWNGFKRLDGFISGKIKQLLSWSATQIMAAVTSGVQFLWNFDWTQSDEELTRGIHARLDALNAQLGATLGCAAGQITCAAGALALGSVFKMPKHLLTRAAKEMGEEAWDEFLGNFQALTQQTLILGSQALFTQAFKGFRMFGTWLGTKVGTIEGDFQTAQDQLFGKDSESLVFADWFEDKAVPWLAEKTGLSQIFLEEFFEEGFECCGEILMVFAQAIDDARAEREDMREQVLGVERTVEIVPDRENEGERIILSGREETLRPAITSALTTHQQLLNRDVGQIVGRDITAQTKTQPPTKTLYLNLIWKAQPNPPYSPLALPSSNRPRDVEMSVSLPFVNPHRLDWRRIKRAMGGDGHVVGRFRAYGWLNGVKVECWGNTESGALNRLEELAELCEGELLSVGTSSKRPTNNRKNNVQYFADPVRLYPAYGHITARKLILDRSRGTATIDGNYAKRDERFELWLQQPPDGIKELFRMMQKYYTPIKP